MAFNGSRKILWMKLFFWQIIIYIVVEIVFCTLFFEYNVILQFCFIVHKIKCSTTLFLLLVTLEGAFLIGGVSIFIIGELLMMTSNIMTNGEDITLSSPVCKFMASSSSIFLRVGGKLRIFKSICVSSTTL